MKTALKLAAGLGALSALSGIASVAHAQSSGSAATATATGTATIIQAIAVSKTTDMAFGTIVKPTLGTNVVSLTATGSSRTITGAGNAVAATNSGISSAAFNVTGEGASTYTISVPSTFNMIGASGTLVVTTNQSASAGLLSGGIGTSGSQTFGVGGSFPLSTSTPSGAYTGTVQVTVAYN